MSFVFVLVIHYFFQRKCETLANAISKQEQTYIIRCKAYYSCHCRDEFIVRQKSADKDSGYHNDEWYDKGYHNSIHASACRRDDFHLLPYPIRFSIHLVDINHLFFPV